MVQARHGMIEALTDLINKFEAREKADIGHYKAFPKPPEAGSPYIMCFGQQDLLKSAYPKLYEYLGITYGGTEAGDYFGLPDLRGCVIAGADDMGGVRAFRLGSIGSNIDGTSVGAIVGVDKVALTVAQMPKHNHGGSVNLSGRHKHNFTILGQQYSDQAGSRPTLGGANFSQQWSSETTEAPDHTHTINNEGNNEAHINVQPTMISYICIYAGVV